MTSAPQATSRVPTEHRRLVWSGPALDDLRAIRAHVSREHPSAAQRLATRLRLAVERLASHPESGRLVPELTGSGYREVLVAPYRVVYQVRASDVVILRIWHGRRDVARFVSDRPTRY